MASDEPEGLGGWLILVGLGVVLAPFRVGFFLLSTYVPIFTEGIWETLTTPGNEEYHAFWGPLLIFEIVFNLLLIVSWLTLAVLFFTKHRLFPYVFSGVMLVALVFIPIDALAFKLVWPDEPVFDPDTTKQLVQQVIGCLIWVPYMFVSRRVKNTFVN